jgi:hypothetical protein
MRIAWSRLLILLIALPLGSCLDRDEACPTCPPEASARLELAVPKVGPVDSARFSVDGSAFVTVKRDKRGAIGDLTAGDHAVEVIRYYSAFGIVSTQTNDFSIRLDRGELRVIVLHHNFPLIAFAAPRARAPAPALSPFHSGWAGA